MNPHHNWVPEGIYFHNLEPFHLKDPQNLVSISDRILIPTVRSNPSQKTTGTKVS